MGWRQGWSAALWAAAATPALAQGGASAASDPAATPAPAPGEIVVTAQKRSESLQKVPLAVSVVSGEAVAAQGRPSLESAASLIPALNFQKSGTTLNQSLFLRGVGTATFSIAGEPSVSTVIDGVVYSRPGEAFSDLIDIDQIEVLRGPQGTLFGKNASAGVINITTRQPGRRFGGYAEASFYTASEVRTRGAVDVPLSDTLLTRFSGFYGRYNGNIHNVALGRRVNGYQHEGGRAQINWTPSTTARFALIADYHHNNDDCCAEVIGTGPLNAAGQPIASAAFAALPAPRGDKSRAIAQDLVTRTRETGYGISLQGDFTLGTQTVTTITAYRDYKNTEIRDGDFLPRAYAGFNQLHDFGPQRGHTFSQEVRIASPLRQFLSYVVGAYYSRAFSERIFRRDDQVCTSAAPATSLVPCDSAAARPSTFPSGTADFGSVFKTMSLFGQGTANLTSRLRLIGGARFTADELTVFHSRDTLLAGPGINPSFPATPTGTGQPAGRFNGKATNTNLSGKAAVQYDLTRAVTGYVSYTRGYKGPAFNVFYNLTATGTNAIAPETSNSFEIGLKNSLFGGTLVLNLDAFYAKYHNFQANNPDLVAGVVVTRFTNAGAVSTRGGEADLLWRPLRDLSVTGGIAYTDAHVDRFFQAPGAPATAVIPAGTSLQFAPRWKGSLAADYRWRTGGAIDLFFGAQGNAQSKQLALFSPDPVQRQLATIKGYGLINLSAGIGDRGDRYRLTVQVRNLLDQSFAAAIQNGGPSGSYRYQIPRDADRYVGVTGRVNF
ncbi:TonB-dependent receptor [Sphingomonas morindae]|uniref:TonB-dependent receptor n=1 Tax=Sphingomonas morindae TaxID=1541170 RepID=A0ABY4XD70_9SPHN|nr:TonB-dependent receptor [Sphingomonas morindae]USI74920.1 TonB-dependent receptor [Sphingomonas morindae]